MKRELLLKALCCAGMLSALPATAQSVVFSETFANPFEQTGWTQIDADGDGNCWQITSKSAWVTVKNGNLAASFTRNPDNYNVTYGAQDNWLVSPAIAIPNDACVLTFDYAAQDEDQVEPLSVLVSENYPEGGTEGFEPLLSRSAEAGYDGIEWENIYGQTLAKYSGKTIYLAFRHKASATYALTIDNIKVSNQKGPKAPTLSSATADADGELKVTLSWTNPGYTATGDAITGLDINVYRDSQLLTTISGATPGEAVTWTDENVTGGKHTYYVTAKTDEGESGPSASRTAIVGPDVPNYVSNLVANVQPDGSVVITWDAPTKGASGGVFNPANVTYKVIRTIDGSAETIKEGLKTLRYVDTPVRGKNIRYDVLAVNAAGESAINTPASVMLFDSALADINATPDAVKDNSLSRVPMELNSKYSVFQTIYYPEELGFVTGDINHIIYKVAHATESTINVPARVYIASTDLADLSGKWAPVSADDLVFEGTFDISWGDNDMAVTLDKAFDYKGGNIVVTVIKDDSPNGSYSDRFYAKATSHANRTYSYSTYSKVDIANLPSGTSTYSTILNDQAPATRFIITAKNVGSLSGKITNEATGAPVKATVSVPAYEGMATTTDADGNYHFTYVPVSATTIHIEAQGYNPADAEVAIADGAATVKDIALRQLAKYTLKGSVVTDDTEAGAAGATVSLSGYEEITVTADDKGVFEFPEVYSGKYYSLKIEYPLYDIYTAIINFESEGTETLDAITVERSRIAAYGVTAEKAADGSAITLSWLDPLSRTAEPGIKSIGTPKGQKYTGGDYSSEDYNIGHAFTAADLSEQKMEGLVVKAVRVWLQADKGQFEACVWEGTRDANVKIASQPLTLDMISPEGGWVEVAFDHPAELHAGKNYIVGLHLKGASNNGSASSVVGTDNGSTIYDGNNLKWGDDIYSNGYNYWCIEAVCRIPGTDLPIAANENAPACSYNIYRANIDAPDAWTRITPAPISDTSSTDTGWSSLVSGDYIYAVTAVYHNGESQAAYSETLSRSIDTDAGVSAFISPAKSVETRESVEVTVKVTNFGEKPVGNFTVGVRINDEDAPRATATCTATLNKGESAEISLGTVALAPGVEVLKAFTSLEGDENPANDMLTFTVPNNENIELMGYRWDAMGYAGVMKVQTNDPESAEYLLELIPNDALIYAAEHVAGKYYAYTATWYGLPVDFVTLDAKNWTLESAVPTEAYFLDMTYDYQTSTMYGVAVTDAAVVLATVNLEDGSMTEIAPLSTVVRTLAADLDGNLYGVSDDGKLYSIDSASAAMTEIGDTGMGSVTYLQSMAFDHNTGRLFWAHTSTSLSGRLHEIDPATGKATEYGTVMKDKIDPTELVGLYTAYEHKSDAIGSINAGTASLSVSADADGIVTVSAPEGAKLTVYNAAGSVVYTSAVAAGSTKVAATTAPGVYAAVATDASGAKAVAKFAVK